VGNGSCEPPEEPCITDKYYAGCRSPTMGRNDAFQGHVCGPVVKYVYGLSVKLLRALVVANKDVHSFIHYSGLSKNGKVHYGDRQKQSMSG